MNKHALIRGIVSALTNFIFYGFPCSAISAWRVTDISPPPPGVPPQGESFTIPTLLALLFMPFLQALIVVVATRSLKIGVMGTTLGNWVGLVLGGIVTSVIGNLFIQAGYEEEVREAIWTFIFIFAVSSIGIGLIINLSLGTAKRNEPVEQI